MFYNLAVASFIAFQLLVYLPIKFLINVIMSLRDGEPGSDDEVFYGQLSLKELKHMFISQQNKRQTIGADEHPEEENHNTSLKLISTHSAPNITSNQNCITCPDIIPKALSNTTLSPDEPNLFANWDVTSSENSFLKLEKMVEKSCDTSTKEFDNTLEEIEYILKTSPYVDKKITTTNDCRVAESKADLEINKLPSKGNGGKLALNTTPLAMLTPMKQGQKEKEVFTTPSSVLCSKPNIYRTPANPPLIKKPSSSLKKTPSKNNAFQHVASPVAYYINNTPQIPLIQNVHPKKTLSSIPKLVKSSAVKPSNKENVNLPSVAYKSAKKTKLIDVPNGYKMPQSQWAKKLTKSLPRPAVIKHTHREKESSNKPLLRKTEDSFGDLSLHQADISVCTKKAAF